MTGNFADNGDLHAIVGFFYMPHICDMGQTALIPLRRKVLTIFSDLKYPTFSAGLEPANSGTKGWRGNL
jgi:hypothetical protein